MAEMIGSMTGALQGTVGNVINQGQNLLDRFFPPEKRAELSAKLSKFATEKPMLASFLLSQFALSGIPLLLFVVMTITVFVFALVAALVIGLLGALLFTAFCVGVALLVLLPVLFITTFAGAFIWLWGVAGYYILKWFNKKDIPGIHTSLPEGIPGGGDDKSAGDELSALNGDARPPPPSQEKRNEKPEEKKSESEANGHTGGIPGADKVSDMGKATGIDSGSVGDLKKKADVGNATKGVKDSVPGGLLG